MQVIRIKTVTWYDTTYAFISTWQNAINKQVKRSKLSKSHTYQYNCREACKWNFVHLVASYQLNLATNPQQILPMELSPWCIALLALTVIDARNRGPPSTELLTLLNSMPWRNFSKFTIALAKMRRVSQTTPILGVIYHFIFGKIDIIPMCTKFSALSSGLKN